MDLCRTGYKNNLISEHGPSQFVSPWSRGITFANCLPDKHFIKIKVK